MQCDCGIEFPPKWNFCSACGRYSPKRGGPNSVIMCDKCGRSILIDDNYCWFCREPNRFKMAAILFEMKA